MFVSMIRTPQFLSDAPWDELQDSRCPSYVPPSTRLTHYANYAPVALHHRNSAVMDTIIALCKPALNGPVLTILNVTSICSDQYYNHKT